MERHLFKSDVWADEVGHLIGVYLAQSLKSGNLGLRSQLGDGSQPLFLIVAEPHHIVLVTLAGRFAFGFEHLLVLYLVAFVAYSEQWRLQNIDMALLDEVGEELEEEGDDEQTDVHTVDIGIGSHDDLVVAQVIKSFFDVERRLQQVELLVLIYHLLGESE